MKSVSPLCSSMETHDHPVRLTLDELVSSVGTELAVSRWVLIDQDRIDRFAAATEDHQWIHTDPQRAASSSFGGTIAHGFLTLSLLSGLRTATIEVVDLSMSVNYGLDRVRFIAPVPVGSHLRARFSVESARAISPREYQIQWTATVERESDGQIVCVASPISRLSRA